MIFDAAALDRPALLRADLCVVGAGPGGLTAAAIAAEAGLRVVVLEPGPLLTPAAMDQREESMLPQLLWDSGGRTSTDRRVKIHQGRGVGGSSLHNLNLCKRIPTAVRDRWRRERGLGHLPTQAWDALYDEVESLLAVDDVPRALWSTANHRLEAATRSLGWRGGPLHHNRTGCVGSGFCELGCAYDAKNNAAKILLPRAVRAGAEILTRVQAVRVRHRAGVTTGVEATAVDGDPGEPHGDIRIEAPRVCLAASATGTPALLLRSRIPDPGGETGQRLHLHPGVVVAGEFDDPVHAWRRVPQAWECTEFLDFDRAEAPGAPPPGTRLWIVPAFAHPVGAAVLLPGHGPRHRDLMQRYAHLAAFSAMLHDRTVGTVRPHGALGLAIDYQPDAEDRRELGRGLVACAQLLFAAGARRVVVPCHPTPAIIERPSGRPGAHTAQVDALAALMANPDTVDLTAVHPMGSVPMGDDPAVAAVDSNGAHHHLGGLWVADGSLFPSSIGVPPQLSIYALGLHVGRAIARS